VAQYDFGADDQTRTLIFKRHYKACTMYSPDLSEQKEVLNLHPTVSKSNCGLVWFWYQWSDQNLNLDFGINDQTRISIFKRHQNPRNPVNQSGPSFDLLITGQYLELKGWLLLTRCLQLSEFAILSQPILAQQLGLTNYCLVESHHDMVCKALMLSHRSDPVKHAAFFSGNI